MAKKATKKQGKKQKNRGKTEEKQKITRKDLYAISLVRESAENDRT